MKKLTKIKLIHWHLFDNHTFPIHGNTLITGENGHGKSTLLDAIHYVLSAGKGKFNEAANNRNNRTLETYVRGKIGYEGEKFLRDQANVSSYIILEFYDEEKKKFSLLGTYIEVPFTNTKHGIFFHIDNSKLEESYFISENRVLPLSECDTVIKTLGKTMNFYKNLTQAKEMVRTVLGVNKKYFELLPKALAFRPIDRDVSKFVYDFLLDDENPVNITRLKSDFRSYNEINKILVTEKEKLEALKPLETSYQKFQQIDLDIKMLKITQYEVNRLQITEALEKSQTEESQITLLLEQIQKQLAQYGENYQEFDHQLTTLKTSDIVNSIHELEKQEEYSKKKLNDLTYECGKKEKELQMEMAIASTFQLNLPIKWPISAESYVNFKRELPFYLKRFDTKKDEIRRQYLVIDNQIIEYGNKQKDLFEKITQLKKKEFPFPREVQETIHLLTKTHQERYGAASITITPLCQLIEINDIHQKWRNSIEELLADRRFDLFVNSSFTEKELKELFIRLALSNQIHHSGVVLNNQNETSSKSPFVSMLETSHPDARRLLQDLLSPFKPVETEQDLTFEGAVHFSGLKVQNNTIIQMDHQASQTPFIGQAAIKIQLDQVTKSYNEITDSIKSLRKQETELSLQNDQLKKSNIRSFEHYENKWLYKDEENNKLEKIQIDLKNLKKNNDWIGIENQINQLKAKMNSLKDAIEQLTEDRGRQKALLDQQKKNVSILSQKLDDHLLENELIKLRYEQWNLFKQTYDVYVTTTNHEYSLQKIREKLNQLESEIMKLYLQLTRFMDSYISRFDSGQLNSHIDSVHDFIDLLNQIRTRNLTEYEGKAKEALEKCYTSFKEDFISKLNASILEAETIFDNLNKSLRTKPFGSEKDIYNFKYEASKDPHFAAIYKLLKSGEDFNKRDLFVKELSSRNETLLEGLFSLLTGDENDEKLQAKIRDYTDYRKYMSYDIEVKNIHNKKYLLSEEYRAKSGGETQTPFYVIIAASFHLLTEIRKNTSPASVVLFDEAFNNMDEMRIESMMNFYKELNIQLFIAVPTLRSKVIMPHVDQTYGLIKSNEVLRAIPYTKQKEAVYGKV